MPSLDMPLRPIGQQRPRVGLPSLSEESTTFPVVHFKNIKQLSQAIFLGTARLSVERIFGAKG